MDGIKERISRAVRNQPQPTVTILSSLLAVEDELAYIPKQAIEEVAALMGATINTPEPINTLSSITVC